MAAMKLKILAVVGSTHADSVTRVVVSAVGEELRKAGCEVKWFKPDAETGSKLHAKLGIFDDEEVILGSANWTGNGLTWNREANVDIVDKDVAGYYAKMFEADFKKGLKNPQYIEGDKTGAAG